MAIKVLLIDDELALRKSLGKLLELRQYEVDEAEDFKPPSKKSVITITTSSCWT